MIMDTTDDIAAFALFQNKNEVKTAIRSLRKLGFDEQNFRILTPTQQGSKDFVSEQKNQIVKGAVIGAIIGIIIGFILALLIVFNIIFIPISFEYTGLEKGFLLLAGMICGSFFGAGAGALVGIGTPFSISKRYGRYLSSGGYLLSVQGDNREQMTQAEKVLMAMGGQDIHLAKEYYTRISAAMESARIAEFESDASSPQDFNRF